jgi:hypothetical protein
MTDYWNKFLTTAIKSMGLYFKLNSSQKGGSGFRAPLKRDYMPNLKKINVCIKTRGGEKAEHTREYVSILSRPDELLNIHKNRCEIPL